MATHTQHGMVAYAAITLLGTFLVAGSLTGYQVVVNSYGVIETHQVAFLEIIAYATLGLLIAGVTVALFGITFFLRKIAEASNGKPLSNLNGISLALADRQCRRIFFAVATSYGLVFAAVSSSLVFQLGPGFSTTLGVQVPSIVPVVCCGPLGQMPQFVLYITQQVALLVIPLNVILLFSVAWLVGLNAATLAYAVKYRMETKRPGWVGGVGATVGLFTACPTCAGFIFLEALGFSGAASASLTLASLQGIFILVGIPILLFALLLTSREVQAACVPNRIHRGPS